MKITNFSFTLRQAATEVGYGDNYYVNIDENGVVNIGHPYKSIEYKEQVALLAIIQSGIAKYALLVAECDTANQGLKLEEYAPQASSTEVSSSESTDVSAAPQSCALGDEEVSTRAVTMDEAKTPEQMLEAMIASGERKEVRDLPM